MTELDILKTEWQRLRLENEALDQKNRELTHRIVHERVKTNQQKLAANYRIGYFGLMFPFLAWTMYKILNISVWLCVCYSVYGLIACALQIVFMYYLKNIDYTSMTTVEAIKVASKIVYRQNRGVLISTFAALMIIVPLFCELADLGGHVVIGGIAGGVIGGTVGIIRYLRNRRLAKQVLEELKSLKIES